MFDLQKHIETEAEVMAHHGVPDLPRLLRLQPGLVVLKKSLPAKLFAKIDVCCKSDSGQAERCHISICPRCSTTQRIRLVKAACQVQFNERLRCCFVTYIPPGQVIDRGQLRRLSSKELVQNFVANCKLAWTASHSTILVIGSPDVSLNEDKENRDLSITAAERKRRHKHQVHYHFVIIAEDPLRLAQLLKSHLLADRKPMKGEFMVKPTHCTGRTILYCTKYQPVRRAATRDLRGNRDRQSRPLAKAAMAEILNWLAVMSENERVFSFFHPGRTTP